MKNHHNYEERVIALSGLVLASYLVSNIARTGMVSQGSLDISLNSIFITNPGDTRDVFEGTAGIATGIRVCTELIEQFNLANHSDIVRYGLGLIQIERKLSLHPDLMRDLGARISLIDEKRMLDVDRTPIIDDRVVADLADLYQAIPGTFQPKISVVGKQIHLENETSINKIRALLLAGIRSAVLWYQLGGRRWQFLVSRRSIHKALSNLKYC